MSVSCATVRGHYTGEPAFLKSESPEVAFTVAELTNLHSESPEAAFTLHWNLLEFLADEAPAFTLDSPDAESRA